MFFSHAALVQVTIQIGNARILYISGIIRPFKVSPDFGGTSDGNSKRNFIDRLLLIFGVQATKVQAFGWSVTRLERTRSLFTARVEPRAP